MSDGSARCDDGERGEPRDAAVGDDASQWSRRRLLGAAGALAAGASVGWLATIAASVNEARRARVRPTPLGDAGPEGARGARVLTPPEWRTLDVALDVLLPSGPGSPGARDCGGIAYLDAALADRDTDPTAVELVRSGVPWLDADARAARAADFASATPEARESAMRAMGARERGPDWMTTMLAFGLEAMLGDPVHGGNPGEVGWSWVGHVPGDPRPTLRPSTKTVETTDPRGPR